jgi:hypothetical protein
MMKRTPCEHWVAVADAKAIGRSVSHDDIFLANRHEATCASCAEEAEVWRSLSRIAAGPPATSGIRLGGSTPPPRRRSGRPEDDTLFDSVMRSAAIPAREPRRTGMGAPAMWAALSIAASAALVGGLVRGIHDRDRSAAKQVQGERTHEPSDPTLALGAGLGRNAAVEPEVRRSPPASPDDTLAAASAHPSAPPAPAVGSPLDPSVQDLAHGNALRAQGDFRGAAVVYRAVVAAGPRSTEGRTALVSLGELLLSELGDPDGALAAFDDSLSLRGGALTRQAAYGRIRALHALGRGPEERAAARVFLTHFRTGPEADALRLQLRLPR